jgi:hypothetical protein
VKAILHLGCQRQKSLALCFSFDDRDKQYARQKQLLSDCENQGGARGDFCRVETVEISLNNPNHSRAKRISIQEWDLTVRLDGTLMKAVRFEVKKGVWDQCQTF